jgi:ketosteroid isomerase-like protein
MPLLIEGSIAMVTLELMRKISAAFNSRDVERIVECFADDGVFCLARGPESVGRTLRGKATIRKALADRFRQIPDMRWENEEYILAGPAGGEDRAISLWTVRGRGNDGEALNYQGCDIYRFDQGDKIIHKNTFWKIVQNRELL